MNRLSIIFTFLLIILFSGAVQAQEMAGTMRSNGKIYVVVFVLATIFAGIFCFMLYLERRMKKLESNYKNTKHN